MIKVISIRSRYVQAALADQMTTQQLRDWDADATKCETLLNDALNSGFKILERWPSSDGHILNIVIGKPDLDEYGIDILNSDGERLGTIK